VKCSIEAIKQLELILKTQTEPTETAAIIIEPVSNDQI